MAATETAEKMTRRQWKKVAAGLAFISPNILGFLAFTVVPLVFSFVLAFSNWDLKLHNMYKDESIRFAGVENFARLFGERDFWKFLGNTLFLMIGLPIGIAGSLGAALLLTRDLKVKSRRMFWYLMSGAILLASVVLLAAAGLGATAVMVLVVGLGGLMLVGGVLGGSTVYRTLFYLPHFTSGVAVYILWKKMYNPHTGPVNGLLAGPLRSFGGFVNLLPGGLVRSGLWVCVGLMAFLVLWGLNRLRRMWSDGELGVGGGLLATAFLILPIPLCVYWSAGSITEEVGFRSSTMPPVVLLLVCAVAAAAYQIVRLRSGALLPSGPFKGLGTGLTLAVVLMIAQFVLFGLGNVLFHLPAMAADGLDPPDWLSSVSWAKPAIMIMGLWGAIGSNTMLLYLAGLSNVPQELYEAADIDGASSFQRFWHVTWPQLAPITFFVIVMGVIGGLQGGFEMARTMTRGGPYGATTTLSYFIYTEGFETGALGYASSVAWALFVMVFVATMFNWKFGSRYVNE